MVALQFLASFVGGFFAVLLALWIDRKRLPNLDIRPSEEAHLDVTYPAHHMGHGGERWKYFSVAVRNEPLPKPFSWIPRQPAENCRATISFFKLGEDFPLFVMLGRWASTPEVAYLPNGHQIVKVTHPDPVTIAPGNREILNVVAKHENDREAYGWNNDSYLHEWRTLKAKLDPGNYIVKIDISTQNGVSFSQKCSLRISDRIDDTYLK